MVEAKLEVLPVSWPWHGENLWHCDFVNWQWWTQMIKVSCSLVPALVAKHITLTYILQLVWLYSYIAHMKKKCTAICVISAIFRWNFTLSEIGRDWPTTALWTYPLPFKSPNSTWVVCRRWCSTLTNTFVWAQFVEACAHFESINLYLIYSNTC